MTFADGYTKRANSATLLPSGAGEPRDALATIIEAYRRRGLPAIYRITPLTQEFGIDEILDAQNFVGFDETCVHALDLGPAPLPAASNVALAASADDAWRGALATAQGLDAVKANAMRRILDRIQGETIYGTALDEGEPAGWGMAVVSERTMGLFNIVTDRARRGRGVGGRLVRALIQAGVAGGARQAYLQVTATNAAAISLYRGIGFKERYRYHYRRSP